MDPITIIASVIAFAQAGDRLIQLVSTLRLYSEEIGALINEVSDLRLVLNTVLNTVQNTVPDLPRGHLIVFGTVLDTCNKIVLELENTLNDFSVPTQKHRLRWLKKKTKVEGLRQRLRDAKSTLTLALQLLNINPSILCRYVITKETLYETSSDVQIPQEDTHSDVDYIDENHENHEDLMLKASPTSPLISPASANGQIAVMQTPSLTERRQVLEDVREYLDSPSQLQNEGMLCAEACKCSCHYRLSRHFCFLNGYLGSLLISCTGRPLNPEECDRKSCIQRCTPRFLVVYYVPRWFPMAAVSLAFSNGGRPHIALSFPRIMPPDSDLFIYIRTGQCERIKELLGSGKASVADIAAPYGLTPLTLAIIYDQADICRLLIRAGAHQLAPNYTWTTSDMWSYFIDFSLFKSSLAAGALLQDFVRLCSAKSQVNALRSCILEPGFEGDSFTRLHKCVLGLTSESVDEVGRVSRGSINETDSVGRTALHWAAYTGNATAMEGLLRCGADPNICDRTGSTPLHVAAGQGSATCINALVAAGANLELRDRFGATPLHHASSQGEMGVIEILLNKGADCEAEDHFGETPISYAIYGRRTSTVKILLNRGAEFDHEDKWGFTSVLDAVFVDSHDVLDFLLLVGTRTSAKLLDDKTLLHVVALNSDLRTVEILQNAHLCGLDTAAVDAAGYTALEYVLQRKDAPELIEPFCALLRSIAANSNDRVEEIVTPRLLYDSDDEQSLDEVFVDAVESQSAS